MKQFLSAIFAFVVLNGITICSSAGGIGDSDALLPKPSTPIIAYAWCGKSGQYDCIVPFCWLTNGNSADPLKIKAATDAMPIGQRVIFSWDMHRDINTNKEDRCRNANGDLTEYQGIWWERGTEQVRQRFDAFFKAYKEGGGKLDYFVLDFEVGMSNWSFDNNAKIFDAIQNDSRFPELSAKLGFSDLNRVLNWRGGQDYLKWNALMAERTAAYVNQAVYEPIRRYFPDVKMSNYGAFNHRTGYGVPDKNGHMDYLYGSGAHIGTHQSKDFYARLGNICNLKLDGKTLYGRTPFNAFRYDVNAMRSMYGAADAPVHAWISYKTFGESLIRDNDYYQELLFHLGLCGADAFLLWNPYPGVKEQNPDSWANDATDDLVNKCLRRLNSLVGTSDRRPLKKEMVSWDADYVLSGMDTGKRSVWRFTPRLENGTTLSGTLRSRSPATFAVGGVTVTIPGGEIEQEDNQLSNCGFWVLAPRGSVPNVVVNDKEQAR